MYAVEWIFYFLGVDTVGSELSSQLNALLIPKINLHATK
jgi:hypothetical protein